MCVFKELIKNIHILNFNYNNSVLVIMKILTFNYYYYSNKIICFQVLKIFYFSFLIYSVIIVFLKDLSTILPVNIFYFKKFQFIFFIALIKTYFILVEVSTFILFLCTFQSIYRHFNITVITRFLTIIFYLSNQILLYFPLYTLIDIILYFNFSVIIIQNCYIIYW